MIDVNNLTTDYRKLVDEFNQYEFFPKIQFISDFFSELNVAKGIGDYEKIHAKRFYLTSKLIEETLADLPRGDVADLGATFASMAMWKKASPQCKMYLSLSQPIIDVLRRERYKNVEVFAIDLEKQPLPVLDSSVIAVGLFEVIEHLYIDPMYVLSEINRILHVGGKLLITTPNICSWRAVTALLTSYEPYLYGKYAGPGTRRHVHEYSVRNMKILLEAAGLEVNIWTENFSSHKSSDSVHQLLEQLGAPKGDRGDSIIAVGTKRSSIINRYPEEIYDLAAMENPI